MLVAAGRLVRCSGLLLLLLLVLLVWLLLLLVWLFLRAGLARFAAVGFFCTADEDCIMLFLMGGLPLHPFLLIVIPLDERSVDMVDCGKL